MSECKECGSYFVGHYNQKYCSLKCRNKHSYSSYKERRAAGLPTTRGGGRKPPTHVQKIENKYVDKRVCYKCSKLLNQDMFYTKTGRECKSCRSHRARNMGDREYRQALCGVARSRAKKLNLPFTLLPSDIIIPERCPVFGFRLKKGSKKQRDFSPSIDRICPEKGYTPDNIIVVSWLANNIRRNFSVDQLRKVADFYETFLPTTSSSR